MKIVLIFCMLNFCLLILSYQLYILIWTQTQYEHFKMGLFDNVLIKEGIPEQLAGIQLFENFQYEK
jgi:hypothetical protein